MTRVLAVLVFSLFAFSRLIWAADSIAIVTAPANPIDSIAIDSLKQVYLRKSFLDGNGTRWIPLNLPVSHQLRQDFSMALFKKKPEAMENFWNEQYFHGITPPQVVLSEEAVLRFVEITPGAIGYVYKRNVDSRVKIIAIIPVLNHN